MLRLAVLLGAIASVQGVYYWNTCQRDLVQYGAWRKERYNYAVQSSGVAYYNKYLASQYTAQYKAAQAMGDYNSYVRQTSRFVSVGQTYRSYGVQVQARINAHNAALAAYRVAQEKVWINAFNAGKSSRTTALNKVEAKANEVRAQMAAIAKVSKDIKAWRTLYSKQIVYLKRDLTYNNNYWNRKTYADAMKNNAKTVEHYNEKWEEHAQAVLKFYKSSLFAEFHKWAVVSGASALREKGWYQCDQKSYGIAINGVHQTAGCAKPKDYSKTIPSYSQTGNLIGYYDSAVLLRSRSTSTYSRYMQAQENELSAMKYRATAILQLAGTWEGKNPLKVEDTREE